MKGFSARWLRIALINFLVAASIGLLLRFAFVQEVKWVSYKSFQDAHSNLALLGWIFQAISACLVTCYIPDLPHLRRKYNIIFIFNQTLIFLITLSFLLSLSRIISNVFLILLSVSLINFAYSFIKDVPEEDKAKSFSYRFAITGLFFLICSFIGLYTIIPILLLAGSANKVLFYYLGVQFFLHFQYNGWFTFAILTFIFRNAESSNIRIDKQKGKTFLFMMIIGVILNFLMSIYWGYRNHQSLLWISSAGTLLQVYAIYYCRDYLKTVWLHLVNSGTKQVKYMLWFSLTAFSLKMIMQLITIVPEIASLAFTIHNYVIAYLHLTFIGVMTFFIIAWAIHRKLLWLSAFSKAGILGLAIGFILMELILFIQGTMLWAGLGFLGTYYELIFAFSLLLPLGLMLIIVRSSNTSYH